MAIIVRHLSVTVTTAGTAVPITTDTLLRSQAVTVRADPDNIGLIHVGDSTVNSATDLGVPLNSNASVSFEPPQSWGVEEEFILSEIFVDSDTDGDKAIVIFFERVPNG